MQSKYGLANRIYGMETNHKTGKDNLLDLVEQKLIYIDSAGFAKDPELRKEEQGLLLIAMTCMRIENADPDDSISVQRWN